MDQIQVLSTVCKKLNNDIESLASQISLRESAVTQIDTNQKSQNEQFRQLNADLQIKLSKTDANVQKLQADIEQLSLGVREIINSQQDLNRTNAQRQQELKSEVKLNLFN